MALLRGSQTLGRLGHVEEHQRAPAHTGRDDLGQTLRRLRRRADLSQRELALRAGVPASTVARIESGGTTNPRWRTVQRLVNAAGGSIHLGVDRGATPDPVPDPPTPPPPAGGTLTDAAGRRYPAHLDVRQVQRAEDWWGAWWAGWYHLPRHRWPRQAPDHTFDLNRNRRDQRRRRLAGPDWVAQLRIRHSQPERGPTNAHEWTAYDPAGAAVGWLGGVLNRHTRERPIFEIRAIEVAPAWRELGVGRRLVEHLQSDIDHLGATVAHVLIGGPGPAYRFFRAVGFRTCPFRHAQWLTLAAAQPAGTQARSNQIFIR